MSWGFLQPPLLCRLRGPVAFYHPYFQNLGAPIARSLITSRGLAFPNEFISLCFSQSVGHAIVYAISLPQRRRSAQTLEKKTGPRDEFRLQVPPNVWGGRGCGPWSRPHGGSTARLLVSSPSITFLSLLFYCDILEKN